MTNEDHPEEVYPHERPGAVLIWPNRNPYMVYDPETKRVTDTKTGEYLGGGKSSYGDAGVRRVAIYKTDGTTLHAYELKYGEKKVDGTTVLTIWQVFWAVRGEDSQGNIQDVQIPGREKAKNDSLERLAEFLRARSAGISEHFGLPGRKETDETVVVDRRKDDPIEIRNEKLF